MGGDESTLRRLPGASRHGETTRRRHGVKVSAVLGPRWASRRRVKPSGGGAQRSSTQWKSDSGTRCSTTRASCLRRSRAFGRPRRMTIFSDALAVTFEQASGIQAYLGGVGSAWLVEPGLGQQDARPGREAHRRNDIPETEQRAEEHPFGDLDRFRDAAELAGRIVAHFEPRQLAVRGGPGRGAPGCEAVSVRRGRERSRASSRAIRESRATRTGSWPAVPCRGGGAT